MSISLNQAYKNLHPETSNMELTVFTTAVPDRNRINKNMVANNMIIMYLVIH